jgi:hypothetical protein
MEQQVPDSVVQVLRKVSQQQAGMTQLAEVMRQVPGMILLTRQEEAIGWMQGLHAALDRKGYGNVKMSDGPEPRPEGLSKAGGTFVPYAFTSSDLAKRYAESHHLVDKNGAYFSLQKNWLHGMADFLKKGYGGIIIDPESDRTIVLDRNCCSQVLERLNRAGQSTSQVVKPPILVRAEAAVREPPVQRPGREDAASRAFFLQWYRKLQARTVELWQFIEALAFEQDIYAPRFNQNVDGLAWPQMMKDPEKQGCAMAPLFTSAAAAKRASQGGLFKEYKSLSGIEALRWVWAAPANIETVYLDWPDQMGWIKFPTFWALSALFPIFYSIEDRRRIPRLALNKLGDTEGSRPLRPDIAQSLAGNWKHILGVAGDKPPERPAVKYKGRRYLPLFSSQEAFFQYRPPAGVAVPSPQAAAKVGPGQAPFGRWLREAIDLDGAILDPGRKTPLLLAHSDLLALSLLASHPEKGVQIDEVIAAITTLVSNKTLPERIAGSMAASWPRYFCGVHSLANGGAALMQAADTDALAVFSTAQLAEEYIQHHVNERRIPASQMHVIPVLSRWNANVFRTASESFSEILVNPMATGASGLRLGAEGMNAALGTLDEILMPRVEEFIWY